MVYWNCPISVNGLHNGNEVNVFYKLSIDPFSENCYPPYLNNCFLATPYYISIHLSFLHHHVSEHDENLA